MIDAIHFHISSGSGTQAIDAIDNGINQYDVADPPRYIENTNLSARVGRLNPDWIEEHTAEKENDAFFRAMEIAGGEFLEVRIDFPSTMFSYILKFVLNC